MSDQLEIFWASGSPFSWRVLLTAAVKRISYQSRLLEFSKGQTQTPEYLAISPRGKVPALRDGNYTLTESLAIMAYLDRRFPEPPLFGRSAAETGLIWSAISATDNYLQPAGEAVWRPIFGRKLPDQAQAVREAANHFRHELARLEASAVTGGWLAGDALSAADLATYPFLMLATRAAKRDEAQPLDLGIVPLAAHYPALDGWVKRIEALPGYDQTYPPHWR